MFIAIYTFNDASQTTTTTIPRGKIIPLKLTCSSTTPCSICLSDVGKRYHSFPQRTFRALFSSPVTPKFVLEYFAKLPPVRTWTTKDGPNKGNSFPVQTTPIICEKNAPKVVHLMVAVFHSFKTHLKPIAIDAETGRVHPGWLRLYRSNMYVHLRSQLKASLPKRAQPPPKPSPPPTRDYAATARDPVASTAGRGPCSPREVLQLHQIIRVMLGSSQQPFTGHRLGGKPRKGLRP